MKLKLSQIVEATQPLTRLGSEKLSAKIAFRLKRNIEAVNPVLQTFNQECDRLRKDKYGATGKNGLTVPPENRDPFQKEINEMLAEEVDVEIRVITLDELTCEIAALDLEALEWMIVEEKTKP